MAKPGAGEELRILLVTPSATLAQYVTAALQRVGRAYQLAWIDDPARLMRQSEGQDAHLVLLDATDAGGEVRTRTKHLAVHAPELPVVLLLAGGIHTRLPGGLPENVQGYLTSPPAAVELAALLRSFFGPGVPGRSPSQATEQFAPSQSQALTPSRASAGLSLLVGKDELEDEPEVHRRLVRPSRRISALAIGIFVITLGLLTSGLALSNRLSLPFGNRSGRQTPRGPLAISPAVDVVALAASTITPGTRLNPAHASTTAPVGASARNTGVATDLAEPMPTKTPWVVTATDETRPMLAQTVTPRPSAAMATEASTAQPAATAVQTGVASTVTPRPATATATPLPTSAPSASAVPSPSPSPTGTPTGTLVASAPVLKAPAARIQQGGTVDFMWQPTGPLPPDALYEVVWWKEAEDPSQARGIAPPTNEAHLLFNLDSIYESTGVTALDLRWTVLVVQPSPYLRLTRPETSEGRELIYKRGASPGQ